MHSIARLDFGNCEVYGKSGWLTVGRVYCSPRVLWINEPREVWRPGNEDPLLLSFVQAQEGELRLGLPAGSYTLKLSFYDALEEHGPFSSPFYMRVRDIGEQCYILDAIAGVASVSRNETVRQRSGANMNISRLSTCSIALHGRPLAETLDVIAAAGFRKVDLLARMPHFSLDPAECDPVVLKAAAQARGLQIANLGTYVGAGFASDDGAVREKEWADVQRALDLAAFFGARSIRVRPGDDSPACLDRIVPWFQRSAEYAAAKGIYLGFENHGGGISGQPRLCAELSDKVGSPYFGALYEPCNLMHAGVDYRYALHVMRGHITHVHLKDGRFTLDGFQHTMFGKGQIDFPWIFEQLEAISYAGDLALEYELKEPPAEDGLKEWYRAGVALLCGGTDLTP